MNVVFFLFFHSFGFQYGLQATEETSERIKYLTDSALIYSRHWLAPGTVTLDLVRLYVVQISILHCVFTGDQWHHPDSNLRPSGTAT
jgi:hypothetical protein